ncbi:C1 family peptidase [Ralstonia insidiosa]|jgi:hypothetical protein|uniref:C1 family peptidase n=2 Tax=Pseudomonadota TaxID=1224 RepID=UPI00066497DB|nr:C1 family peptidase [Ralstonia insidiosa]KMW46918.1 hypothetical protein AC240_13460 [Ralstonia sp. MD27]MBX3771079.1 hypothetical protein [Ralstonia pickettii]NOZ14340.1 hypothetical protein [Betaproteobacteria bacterium]MBC9964301.1 hypothetical protein [Ralstonia insidiosa]MBX3810412.1 hypothetical protein [Ralstonia pickettii]
MRHKPVLSSLLVWGALAAPAYAQTHHATGLIDDDPVALASVPFRPMYRAYLPPQADVIAYLPAIRSQGEQGSCTAWAAGYNAMSLLFNQKLSADSAASGGLKPRKIEFSPAYVFNLIHRGRCEGGTSVVTALDTIRDHGLVPYGSLPYDQQSCSALPSAAAVEEGKNKRLISYSRIDGDHKAVLEKMRGAIYAHKPVIVGMYTGDMASAFQTYNGGDIFRARLPHENAHAMVVVGYDDASQTFTVANSWGPQWGDKGFLRIDYQALLENLSGPTFVIDEIDDAGVRSILSSAPLNVEPEPKPAPVPVIEPPKPAPVVHDALPTVDDLKTQVMQLAQKPSCSAIRTQVSANRDIVLSGFVGAQADADALLRDVNGLPTRGRVQSQVQVHPWPQCEAYLNFEQELQDGGGLGVKLMDHALAPYTQGDTLSLQVTAPSFPSYLYVAYLQASGEVVYLSWPEPLAPKPTTPKTKLVFGGGKNGQPIYRVSKPFGDEMVIVIAASKPLFPGALPERDNDREFLTKFRTAFLAGGVKRHVAVAVLPIKTLAKESNP